ncbi:hypothetical protein Tco_1082855 [Tanacetum coccineum]|uniref:Uncharacterized protein n=1 Tax=Tanacetum coccineum TaxID=301880 RepID=A0ABQ5I1T9_9ASTR
MGKLVVVSAEVTGGSGGGVAARATSRNADNNHSTNGERIGSTKKLQLNFTVISHWFRMMDWVYRWMSTSTRHVDKGFGLQVGRVWCGWVWGWFRLAAMVVVACGVRCGGGSDEGVVGVEWEMAAVGVDDEGGVYGGGAAAGGRSVVV